MSLSPETPEILQFMGFVPEDDFSMYDSGGVLSLVWHVNPHPTDEEIAQQELPLRNSATWAAQAAARKDREAKAALALPDSDDPVILRRKLNAALHLIQR